ncbi:hypothetical protein BKA67DRAFT_534009 [Truncatella angustata]|uniref:Uncharacterized protein n=1 Tax=Truncatella angustata TaxID=152316 RepID=A0A9P8UMV4_9PEZI|nr:uncharacterized protein BKA67DRAFT_534009 [Truncatella angustata]KAH6655065.1 hypothetical protein BKA67DRAFT_534009 [Truncatella angustata]KAH8195410.1 hypothetical protein TruAng_010417 [Truncatella angustata]
MATKRPEHVQRHGVSEGSPSSVSASPEHRPSSMRHDFAPMKSDFELCQKNFKDACCSRQFEEAAVHHKKLVDLRRDLSSLRPFPLAAQIDANLRQATILLMCKDFDGIDRSLFPDIEHLSRQRDRHHGSDAMAWGVLCAKVGFLYMRSLDKADLKTATTFFDQSLKSLLGIKPVPTEHILPIAQCLADLYDFMAGDALGAEELVKWLGEEIGHDETKDIVVGRVSRAINWIKTTGSGFDGQRFDISAMEYALKQNESVHLETMLIWTQRTRPSSTISSKLLLTAADARSMAMCQLLFRYQANVDAVDVAGRTVLHRCVSQGPAKDQGSRKDVLRMTNLFLNKDATLLNKQDFSGKTALYAACEVGYADMVSFLVGVDANANLAENNAQSPLYMACEHGLRHIVKSLVEKARDLDINAKGPGGQTPLTAAVQYAAAHAEGRLVVEMLIKKGADPSIEDNTGKTALNYVGGIWASDLKTALKNAKHRATASSSKPPDHISTSSPSTSHPGSTQRSSRPPSTRSSVFAKIIQPRIRSSASSFFSPSRTSLDTASIAPGSVFSNDMSSRRTSITVPSIYESENDAQLASIEADTTGQAIAQKGIFVPVNSTSSRNASNDDEPRISKEAISLSESTLSAPRVSGFGSDLKGMPIVSSPPASNGLSAAIRGNGSQSTSGYHHVRSSVESNRSSTDSTWDTPSDSEEASHDGDRSPLEVRTHNLPIRSHPEGIRDRPAGHQGQRDGSFDGASSIPTPPSDHPSGAGSQKANARQGSSSGSQGARVSDATQVPGSEQKRQVLLACPFAKKDPITYEHCHKYELKEIKHVKQHLKRCHLISYCARCRVSFPNQLALERHHRDDDACARSDRPVPEGMTLEQHEILKPRTNHKLSLEEQWYFIWDVLFPGRERPATPYKDEFVNLTEFHRIYRDFRDNQIPTLAGNVLREMGMATAITQDQAVALMRRSLMGFAGMLQGSGLITQHDTSSDHGNQSRSTSVTDGAEHSPAPRLNSLDSMQGQLTPDSSGHPAHQSSPQSTRFSDDCYDPLQRIEEVSTTSSDMRQDSVGVSQESAHMLNPAYPGSSQPSLPSQQGVPFQAPEWNNGSYNIPSTGATYGPLSGMTAWGEDAAVGSSATNPLYSADELFNMGPASMEHIINFDVDMDLDMGNAPAMAQTSTSPDYFPMQQHFQGQQMASGPYMSSGHLSSQYPHVPQNGPGQTMFSPTSQQPGNGQQHTWNMR